MSKKMKKKKAIYRHMNPDLILDGIFQDEGKIKIAKIHKVFTHTQF